MMSSKLYTYFHSTLILLLSICGSMNLHAQESTSAARYEVDAKRVGVSPTDKDALPRSREFIRLDSTYYVGYMYEGMYKADRSSDYLGFKNAIPPLRKALQLFEKDYSKNLKKIFTAPEVYMQYANRYIDFLQISNGLRECYDNLEMPDSVLWVLDRIDSYRFKKEHLPTTTTRAWTYHRNRFFTAEKFPFLKNSVEENEKMALSLCYQALGKIEFYRPQNDVWYGPGQAESDKQSVYHYLALLHNYNKNYDSSDYYYQRQVQAGTVSWNNYGTMQHELGNFATAFEYLSKDKYKYFEKTLREPFYYLPMLHVYAGRTKEAMTLSKEAIGNAGSTPGFGWYNLALGRSYMYDGQLDSAEQAIDKAAAFKELHIGTTLTQSQYDFTVNMLKLQLADRKLAVTRFTNRGWWYSPTSLYKMLSYKIEKLLLQYVLINQMAANPERNRTVYDLFCAEATTSFDEAYYLIRGFSPSYFVKKYKGYQEKDQRQNLLRYFKLFTYEMQVANGDDDEAKTGYDQLLKEVVLDTAQEKLFVGRLYEGLCKVNKAAGNDAAVANYSSLLFENYPQLLPFSNIRVSMKLVTSGIDDAQVNKVLKELKKCNIDWVDEYNGNVAVANIVFTKKGDKYEAVLNVKGSNGTTIVANQKMIFKEPEGAGKEIALRMFNKGGAMVYEQSPG